MRQRGWFVEMIRIQGRKEDETERLVRGVNTNTTSEGNVSAKEEDFITILNSKGYASNI